MRLFVACSLALISCSDVEPPTCGEGPYEDVELEVMQVDGSGALVPIAAPVQVRWAGCALMTTDSAGSLRARISTAISPRAITLGEDRGFVPTIHAQRPIVEGASEQQLFVYPADYRTIAPGYCVDDGYVQVQVAALGAGACADPSGVTLSIRDRPELVPAYLSSSDAIDSAASATTARGVAVFAKTPIETLEVVASKPGCVASTLVAGIGLVPTEAGAISTVVARLESP